MNLIEFCVSVLAPHMCIKCRIEGSPVCEQCLQSCFLAPSDNCYICGYKSKLFICSECSLKSHVDKLFIGTKYDGMAADIVSMLKFQRVKAAALVMAWWLDAKLPLLPEKIIVVPAPTANARVRKRGYDQACLIAHSFAKARQLEYRQLLQRVTKTRQVGATRKDRFKQLDNAFKVNNPKKIVGAQLLIIDDVLTTGATIESAAKTLKAAGASKVYVATFAYKELIKS